MTHRNGIHLTALLAAAALVLLCLPDAAFARGGGGGGGGRPGTGTSRVGPAGRGTVRRTRTRASGRGDLIRDQDTGADQRRSSADSRRERREAAERKRNEKPDPGDVQKLRQVRWHRRNGGRSYTVTEFTAIKCTKSERVNGVSYHYCDGAWFEKVFEGGEVRWVEVERPPSR